MFVQRVDRRRADARHRRDRARHRAATSGRASRIVFVKDFSGDENFHVVSVDLDGSDLEGPHAGRQGRADDRRRRSTTTTITHRRRTTGAIRRCSTSTASTSSAASETLRRAEPRQHHRLAHRSRQASCAWRAVTDGVNTHRCCTATARTEPFKPILTTNFKEAVAPLFFTFDNKQALRRVATAAATRRRSSSSTRRRRRRGALLASTPRSTSTALSYSRKRKVLTDDALDHVEGRAQVLRRARPRRCIATSRRKLPGYEIDLQSHDKAEDKFVVAACSDRTRGQALPLRQRRRNARPSSPTSRRGCPRSELVADEADLVHSRATG